MDPSDSDRAVILRMVAAASTTQGLEQRCNTPPALPRHTSYGNALACSLSLLNHSNDTQRTSVESVRLPFHPSNGDSVAARMLRCSRLDVATTAGSCSGKAAPFRPACTGETVCRGQPPSPLGSQTSCASEAIRVLAYSWALQ